MSKWVNQQQKILVHLRRHHSITTLEAREQLFIMHPSGRVKELKKQGHNIVTHRIGKNRIAKYVLLMRSNND
jgi:hypothetical protein